MANIAANDELLTPDEVQAWLKVSRQWLYDANYKKTGPPYIRMGSRLRYRRSAVEEWLREQEQDR
jgi:predicted DNA-binding transcriptional regulator AlpA